MARLRYNNGIPLLFADTVILFPCFGIKFIGCSGKLLFSAPTVRWYQAVPYFYTNDNHSSLRMFQKVLLFRMYCRKHQKAKPLGRNREKHLSFYTGSPNLGKQGGVSTGKKRWMACSRHPSLLCAQVIWEACVLRESLEATEDLHCFAMR